jgi:hypothetical protein
LISREWYRFLLNLFNLTGGGSNPVSITDLMVGPTFTTAESQIAELQKAIQGLELTPPPAVLGDTLNVVLRRLQDLELGPSLSGLVSDIANLQRQIQNAAVTPSDSALRSDIANLQRQVQNAAVAPSDSALVSEVANLKTAIQALEQSQPVIPTILPTNLGTVTSVDVSGGSTGLTFSGGPITTAGTITMAGTLGVANGGTGASSLASAGIVTITGTQTISGQKNFTNYTNTFLGTTYSTSDGGSGSNAYLGENLAYAIVGGVNGVVLASGSTYPGTGRFVADPNTFRPFANNVYALGTSLFRYTTVYAQDLNLTGAVTAGAWNGSTIGVAYGGTGTTTPSLVAGSNISISGSWPNQTITASSSGGTVTSVTASSPLASSGGTTPNISFTGTLAASNGGTGATSLTGAGIVTLTDSQVITGQKNLTSFTNTFLGTAYATSDGGTGSNAYFGENLAYAVIGGVNGVVFASGSSFPGTGRFVADPNTFRPFADNVYALGTGSFRYTVVYATTGTINTSDATQKQQVRELNEAERRVAKTIKGLIRAFKWNEAVESKGDGARIHIGVMAQEVAAAFAAEGLDASKYGLFCQDTWTTLDGSQTRFGVRYEELLAFVIAAL